MLVAPLHRWLSRDEHAAARAAVVVADGRDVEDGDPTERRRLTLRELLIMREAIRPNPGNAT